ncbi:MAG: winged helix-turn-helix domain-containing protein [Candidatus Hodarchaeales archaeon]
MKTHQVFDVLSQKVRFEVVKQLNFSRKTFSEILTCFQGIRSNQLSFHLKKLTESGLIEKQNTLYELTEFGLNTLKFIEAYESDFTDYTKKEPASNFSTSTKSLTYSDGLVVPERPEDLPPPVRTFELFTGKNSEFMNSNFTLPLPESIDSDIHPQKWINTFRENYSDLLSNNQAREWLEDRLLKLAYGTRGLQDFCLMDASVAVPPLKSMTTIIQEALLRRGKVGLFGFTGMGKSRILLYLASWWVRSFQKPVLFIQNPREMRKEEWTILSDILASNTPMTSEDSRWLLIIEDVHLVSQATLERIKKLIVDAGIQSWSIIIAYTVTSLHQTPQLLSQEKREFISSVEWLQMELQPLDISLNLDLNDIWPEWRRYFSEWIKWVALDGLVDLIPWTKRTYEPTATQSFESPWAMVVSLGFLRVALRNLEKTVTDNLLPVVLYGLISLLYILRGEQNIAYSTLYPFLRSSLASELADLYPDDRWEDEVNNSIVHWTDPVIRLLPPIKYERITNKLQKEGYISFYHQEWAHEVCKILLNTQSSDTYPLMLKIFQQMVPSVHTIWSKIYHEDPHLKDNFLYWLIDNVRFEIDSSGHLQLVHLKLIPNQIKHIFGKTLQVDHIGKLTHTQLLNWTMIKKIVSNYQKYA